MNTILETKTPLSTEPKKTAVTADQTMRRLLAALSIAGAVAATVSPCAALAKGGSGSGGKADVKLVATGADADAFGRAKLKVRTASDGRFELRVGNLDASANYELVVSDIRVADLATDDKGQARARFRSAPHSSHDVLLGFDPRGSVVIVRDAAGQDVLAGNLPAGGNAADDTKIACCIPDDRGTECEDRTPDECTAQGGTVSTAATCIPNPCDTATAPSEDHVVCCIPDDAGPECEDRSVEECSARGGIVAPGDTCGADTCAATPAADTLTRCCEADDSGNECEVRLPSECLARGGVDIGEGICSVDACSAVTVPTGNEAIRVRCDVRSGRSRISVDGSGLRDGGYTSHVTSGASEATSGELAAALGQVEFDFDSDAGDVAAGATPISAAFLGGTAPSVTAQILDAIGNVVVEGSAACTVK